MRPSSMVARIHRALPRRTGSQRHEEEQEGVHQVREVCQQRRLAHFETLRVERSMQSAHAEAVGVSGEQGSDHLANRLQIGGGMAEN